MADSYSAGRAFSSAMTVLRTNNDVIIKSAGFFCLLPNLLFGLLHLIFPAAVTSDFRGLPGENFLVGLVGILASNAIVFAGVKGLHGESVSFATARDRGMKVYLATLGISILTGFGIIVGLVFLVVPGVFLLLIWSVAAQVKIMEPLPSMASISRSIDLTRGSRWGILVLYLIEIALVLGLVIVAAVASYIGSLIGSWVVELIVAPLSATAVVVLMAAFSAGNYHEVIRVKEGGGVSTADVFS